MLLIELKIIPKNILKISIVRKVTKTKKLNIVTKTIMMMLRLIMLTHPILQTVGYITLHHLTGIHHPRNLNRKKRTTMFFPTPGKKKN